MNKSRMRTGSRRSKFSQADNMRILLCIISLVTVTIVEAHNFRKDNLKVRFEEVQDVQKLSTSSTKIPTSSTSPTATKLMPSHAPSNVPGHLSRTSSSPSSAPSPVPSLTLKPTFLPTHVPTSSSHPSHSPSTRITSKPSVSSSKEPSAVPTTNPTPVPSAAPTRYDCTGKQDTEDTFILAGHDIPRSCVWVLQSDTKSKCTDPAIRDLCPVTCGLCPGPPSASPTNNPTVAPSSSPSGTNISTYSSIVVVSLEKFSVAMDDKEKVTFQNTVKDFVEKNMVMTDNVGVEITSVRVVSQLRSVGATNGLLDSRDVENDKDKTMRQRSLQNTGLLVEMLISGQVKYGTLPQNFSFRDIVVPGFENDFDGLLRDLEDSFSIYNSVGRQDGNENQGESPRGNKLFIMYLALGCGVGGMILIAAFLLVYKRRRASRHQELQDQGGFVDTRPSLQTIGLESPAGIEGEQSRWSWIDPAENDIKKDLEDPYGLASSLYMSRSNSTHNKQMSIQSKSNTGSSELVTPTGSASTTSMGINLSPEALYEARKQQQNFCFYPPDSQQLGISHSYPDQNGRLVYKSYVCIAPPGALGVIIDTTPEGPMVHAIKPTSQLLGIIAPGDIVVGLDNIETRQMTAPALTRLMARKAQQSERKITLLRPMST